MPTLPPPASAASRCSARAAGAAQRVQGAVQEHVPDAAGERGGAADARQEGGGGGGEGLPPRRQAAERAPPAGVPRAIRRLPAGASLASPPAPSPQHGRASVEKSCVRDVAVLPTDATAGKAV